ncbi:MAG TPA: glycosyltransferase family 9 protein, partial [Flavisolibacter sp.]|nr:glycosyltransferase family 9 protein [Flavisolibacter sp.]
KKELRQLLLTHAYAQPKGLHRADEYVRLLELFSGTGAPPSSVTLQHHFSGQDHIAVNINSEASSRRLTVNKAVELINEVRTRLGQRIILVGAPKEKDFVETVLVRLGDRAGIENAAGKTNLKGLSEILATARLVISTDSGPAHLANALGTPTIVLFGAGNEAHTAPYNKDRRQVVRLGELSCEPCQKNVCVRFGTPQCLERLNSGAIADLAKQAIN